MGSIKNEKVTGNNKVELTVLTDYEQVLLLKGHKTNVHVFSEEAADYSTRIICQGKGATKYIRVPSKISKDMRINSSIKCLRLDSNDKIIIFSVIEK